MTLGSILALALGLAMDATAVAAARGLAAPAVRPRDALLVAALFGGAQALMPLAGWFIGEAVGPRVARWDHWIAFAVLVAVGARMVWEGLAASRGAPPAPAGAVFGLRVLLPLALATSIDAFAVGITLPLLGAPPVTSLVAIGATTAALSAAALFLGRHLGARLGRRLDAAGGAVLMILGVKILVEHLRAP